MRPAAWNRVADETLPRRALDDGCANLFRDRLVGIARFFPFVAAWMGHHEAGPRTASMSGQRLLKKKPRLERGQSAIDSGSGLNAIGPGNGRPA